MRGTKFDDYRCAACGAIRKDVPRDFGVGASEIMPVCPCGQFMDWIPQIGRMDASGGATFKGFSTFDGKGNPVQIDSLRDLRRVERESEQLAKNGEGEQLNWRDYSQDRGNTYTHSLMADPSVPVPKQPNIDVKRHGQKKPRRSLGAGVKSADIGVGAT